jgi:hypothetical protein
MFAPTTSQLPTTASTLRHVSSVSSITFSIPSTPAQSARALSPSPAVSTPTASPAHYRAPSPLPYTMPAELWLSYHQASRAGKPATAQLVELERHDRPRLLDLADVLEHVFSNGFVDAKFRTVCWIEAPDGTAIPASRTVADIHAMGHGRGPEHPLRLVIGAPALSGPLRAHSR